MSPNPRRVALAALRALFGEGRSYADTLRDDVLTGLDPRDRGLARALAYGVARERRLLDAIIDARLDRPLTGKARRLRPVLQLGIFQLGWLRTDDHAAVNETVALVRDRRERGFVNAVLRRWQREGCPRDVPGASEAVRVSYADWFCETLREDWGDDTASSALVAGNEPGPMWVRIDPKLGSAASWLDALGAEAEPGPGAEALRLAQPRDVTALPGFDRGWASVQDAAAQLAAPLVPAVGTGRILDACAAPGGKTLHLHALQPDAEVLALDVSEPRVERLRENLARCGAAVTTRMADASKTDEWWDGEPFAAVLLDAPCTGSGVLRRHPDGKWLRRPEDVEALNRTQDSLLDAAWRVLAPGGAIVYCTCSILRDENDRRIAAFLEREPEARADQLELPTGRAVGHGWQILPGEDHMDGFFYARVRKPC